MELYIYATYRHTAMKIVYEDNQVYTISSSDLENITSFKAVSNEIALKLIKVTIDELTKLSPEVVKVYIKGNGHQRNTIFDYIKGSGIKVDSIKDITPIPHNGAMTGLYKSWVKTKRGV